MSSSHTDVEVQENKNNSRRGIAGYKVKLIAGGALVATFVAGFTSARFTGVFQKSPEPGTTPPAAPGIKASTEDSNEVLAKKWSTVGESKLSELEPELKEFALKNKATAPPEMKAHLEKLELYEFVDTLNEKLLKVKEVMNMPELDLTDENKKFLKSVVRLCQKKGLLSMTEEERYDPIKEVLSNSANLTKADLDEDEFAMENFRALGELNEEERSTILGSYAQNFNELLNDYLIEVFDEIKKSTDYLACFKKDKDIFAQSLNSEDPEIVLQTLRLFDYFLVKEHSIQNIDSVISLNTVLRVASLLSFNFEADSELEDGIVSIALRFHINITVSDSRKAFSIVEAGAVPSIVKLIVHSNVNIRRDAIWALSNIAVCCAHAVSSVDAQTANNGLRDMLLSNGLLSNLLQAIQKEPSNPEPRLLKESARILKTLFKENINTLPWDKISLSISILEIILQSKTKEVLQIATSALSDLVTHRDMVPSDMSRFLVPIENIAQANSDIYIKNCCNSFVTKLQARIRT